jgi:cephalosporin-C deacetylase
MRVPRSSLLIFFVLFLSLSSNAQDSVGTYQVRVSLDKSDWTYELNQPAKFTFAATLNNSQVSGLPLKIACGPEMMPATLTRTVITTDASLTIEAGAMKEPGFFRCSATVEKDGKLYRGLATAGYRPDKIAPIVADPKDFDAFWKTGVDDLKKIPLEPKLELLPSYSTPGVDVYHVSFQNVGSGISRISRIYGILCVPKSKDPNQKFPALLSVPGAGVRPYRGLVGPAEKGIMTLQIGIHGIPVTMDQSVYDSIYAGALNRYVLYNIDDRDTYYYRRVYLGGVRANDFLTSLPQYDGTNLAVIGGSQGGALSIVTASLDPRVKFLAASYPAISDAAGYTAGRAGGWPGAFRDVKNRTKEKLETASYYDAVNFARRLKVPGIYSWGFNDEVVPPTSSFAAYNVITAPKQLILGLEMGHANSAEQADRINNWLERSLKGTK